MNVAEAIRAASRQLSPASGTARLDAELLMAHALGVSRSEVLLRHMDAAVPDGFAPLIDRRSKQEPIAYITGWTEFYGRRFHVEPGILIPRGDSEAVIEAALDACPNPRRVLDMGTGSGALLLTLLCERPQAVGTGIDASSAAIEVAGENAIALEQGGELSSETLWSFHLADWTIANWTQGLGQFDLILCNPPYVEEGAALDKDVADYEPASALFAGSNGLDDYHIIIPQLRALLTEGGVAVLEIGAAQAEAVTQLGRAAGFQVQLRLDLANRARALILS